MEEKWRILPKLLNQKQSFGENESTIILNGRGEEHQKDAVFENLGHGAQRSNLGLNISNILDLYSKEWAC